MEVGFIIDLLISKLNDKDDLLLINLLNIKKEDNIKKSIPIPPITELEFKIAKVGLGKIVLNYLEKIDDNYIHATENESAYDYWQRKKINMKRVDVVINNLSDEFIKTKTILNKIQRKAEVIKWNENHKNQLNYIKKIKL